MIATIFGCLVSAIHVFIFYMESLAWGKPATNKAFGVSAAEAKTIEIFAFNQGFYNLFLAVGVPAGFAIRAFGREDYGNAVADFSCACVVGAGLVLFFSKPKLIRAAMIQAFPAMAYLGFRFLGY